MSRKLPILSLSKFITLGFVFLLILLTAPTFGQTVALSSANVSAGNSAALTLSLANSSSTIAALQWTLQYPSASVSNLSVSVSPAVSSLGKTLTCNPTPGAYTCLLVGLNNQVLADGAVATVTVTPLASVSIAIIGTQAASAAGASINVLGAAGSMTVQTAAAPTLQSLTCSPGALTASQSSTCIVTLTVAAASATSVALSSNTGALSVPLSVSVAAGAKTAQFAAQETSSATQTAVVTATLNSAATTATIALAPGASITARIHAGGPSLTDSQGQFWSADSGFSGGSTWSTTASIANTTDQALYQTSRYGAFQYSLAVPNGAYTVTLKFAEPSMKGPGQRVFNVAINGVTVLSNFDVYSQAGGANRALDRSFPASVSAGQIVIAFSTGPANLPIVSAIQAVPVSTALTRVNAGGPAYTDPSGVPWTADANYEGGQISSVTQPITNTSTPTLYQTCRWGAFHYVFPAPNGSYSILLKFAEISRTGPGQRLFNVAINGSTVLANFDIFAQAGGANRAIDKTFAVSISNGQIDIAFNYGLADAPMVNAIEIDPAALRPAPGVHINSGGPAYTDASGTIWSADTSFTGGQTWAVSQPIANTATSVIYQTSRWGAFTYSIPVSNGNYTVKLKFAEISMTGPGQRLFDVGINDTPVLSNFDVYGQAGGANIALDKSFPVSVSKGNINISFTYGAANAPLVNAIEILPAQ